MAKYFIRAANREDYSGIARVYNSDTRFLMHHLGVEKVDEAFAAQEHREMERAGFRSCVILEKDNPAILGLLDYRPGSQVYLSLLMISKDFQGRGIGSEIYRDFEKQMREEQSRRIRIDVVNDYPGHLVPYWEKLGFVQERTIALKWRDKRSRAVIMGKEIK